MKFSSLSGSKRVKTQYYYTPKQNQARTTLSLLMCILMTIGLFSFQIISQVNASVLQGSPKYMATQPAQLVPEIKPYIREPSRITSSLAQSNIEQWIAGQTNASWAAELKEIGREEVASVHANQAFSTASIYKLFLLPLIHEKQSFSNWESQAVVGMTLKDCVGLMISVSNNPCAESLLLNMTANAIHKSITAEYSNTSFINSMSIESSVRDTNKLLENIYTNPRYADSREFLMGALATPKAREGIRHGCEGCQVYNKTGEYGAVRHDAAIIEKNGKTYVLTIFSENGTWQQITDLTNVVTDKL